MEEKYKKNFIIDKIDLSGIDQNNKIDDNLIKMELRKVHNKLPEEKYNMTKFLKYLNKTYSKRLNDYDIGELIRIWNSDLFSKNKYIYNKISSKRFKPTPYQIIENENEENKKIIENKLIKKDIQKKIDLKIISSNYILKHNKLNKKINYLPPIRTYLTLNNYKLSDLKLKKNNHKLNISDKNPLHHYSFNEEKKFINKKNIENCMKTISFHQLYNYNNKLYHNNKISYYTIDNQLQTY